MGDYNIYIPKVSDKALLNCFFKVAKEISKYNFKLNIHLIGDITFSDIQLNEDALPEGLKKVLEYNSKLINSLNISISKFNIQYLRGGFEQKKSAVYDEIKITNNNSELDHEVILFLIATLSKELKAFDPTTESSEIFTRDQQNQLDIHLSTIKELENLNSELSKKITTDLYEKNQLLEKEFRERQDKLSFQVAEERKKMSEEFNAREEKLKEKISALEKREQEIDLRNNTIVRRELRTSFLEVIKERTSKFQLTSETRKLRMPIHVLCCAVMGVAAYASFFYAREFLSILGNDIKVTGYVVWPIIFKQIAFIAIAGSTFVFYLKWMNRWFEKHAQTEFQLKQLQLDFERANWVVETALEWKKELKSSVIPSHLLSSLTNNLFTAVEEDNQLLHPSDQIASALLGNATKVKVKAGNTDLEFTGKGIQKAEKEIQS